MSGLGITPEQAIKGFSELTSLWTRALKVLQKPEFKEASLLVQQASREALEALAEPTTDGEIAGVFADSLSTGDEPSALNELSTPPGGLFGDGNLPKRLSPDDRQAIFDEIAARKASQSGTTVASPLVDSEDPRFQLHKLLRD